MSDDELPALVAYPLLGQVPRIIPAPAKRDWMGDTVQRFAYRCLPLPMANQSGWALLNNQSLRVYWDGGASRESVSISYGRENGDQWANSLFGHGILTWTVPYLFRTSPGYNLLVRGPANFPKDAACPLEGLVETDWSAATFTMNWKITRPFTEVGFEEGDPYCMIVPQRRGDLEAFQPEVRHLESDSSTSRKHEAWIASRNNHDYSTLGFQKDYLQGRDFCTGEVFSEHQRQLRLRPFVDRRDEESPQSSPSDVVSVANAKSP